MKCHLVILIISIIIIFIALNIFAGIYAYRSFSSIMGPSRWNRTDLSYSIPDKESCGVCEIIYIRRAFGLVQKESNLFRFTELDGEKTDFQIHCLNITPNKTSDIPEGETIIERVGNEINSVEINLYGIKPNAFRDKLLMCNGFPIVDIHEILHGLGLIEHSEDPYSVLFYEDSGKILLIEKIDQESIVRLKELYTDDISY